MKALKLLGCIVLSLLVGWWVWGYSNRRANLLTNGDFEAQPIPEGVMVMTNNVVGWRVSGGSVGLYRLNGNTYVVIPPGVEISQRYLTFWSPLILECRMATASIDWWRSKSPRDATRLVARVGMEAVREAVFIDDFRARIRLDEPSDFLGRNDWFRRLDSEVFGYRDSLAGFPSPVPAAFGRIKRVDVENWSGATLSSFSASAPNNASVSSRELP